MLKEINHIIMATFLIVPFIWYSEKGKIKGQKPDQWLPRFLLGRKE